MAVIDIYLLLGVVLLISTFFKIITHKFVKLNNLLYLAVILENNKNKILC